MRVATLRRRMSHSTRSVDAPEAAIAEATFTETKVLPSLGTEEVMARTWTGLSTLMKRMLAKRVCAALETAWLCSSARWFLLGICLHPFDLGEVAHDGQVRDLLGVLAVPHARVGHVGNDHDHDGHEEPGEKRDRHV